MDRDGVYDCCKWNNVHYHLRNLKALPHQWFALDTAIVQSLLSRMLTSVSPFFLMYLLMVSIYLNYGLPLGHHTFYLHNYAALLLSYGYHLCIWHVHTNVVSSTSCVLLLAELLSLTLSLHFVRSLSPPQHCLFSLIHQPRYKSTVAC